MRHFTCVYLHTQTAIHTHLVNHNYFDHGKSPKIPPIGAPCRDKDGAGFGISGLYLSYWLNLPQWWVSQYISQYRDMQQIMMMVKWIKEVTKTGKKKLKKKRTQNLVLVNLKHVTHIQIISHPHLPYQGFFTRGIRGPHLAKTDHPHHDTHFWNIACHPPPEICPQI